MNQHGDPRYRSDADRDRDTAEWIAKIQDQIAAIDRRAERLNRLGAHLIRISVAGLGLLYLAVLIAWLVER